MTKNFAFPLDFTPHNVLPEEDNTLGFVCLVLNILQLLLDIFIRC